MKCARADRLTGPWEVTTISEEESLGIGQGYRPKNSRRRRIRRSRLNPPDPSRAPEPHAASGRHHRRRLRANGGAYSMQDHNSVGRLTSLSPVTWADGWPYFGLPGNLKRTPSIWVKPNTGHAEPITSPYDRNDDFSGPKFQAVWQWNHVPDDSKWSLSRAPRLSPSAFASGRRFLVGAKLADAARRRTGIDSDHGVGRQRPQTRRRRRTGAAELAVRVDRTDARRQRLYDRGVRPHHRKDRRASRLRAPHVWLRVHCNFDTEIAQFSYSANGKDLQAARPRIRHGVSAQDVSGRPLYAVQLQHRRRAGRAGGLQQLHRGRAAAARADQADPAFAIHHADGSRPTGTRSPWWTANCSR